MIGILNENNDLGRKGLKVEDGYDVPKEMDFKLLVQEKDCFGTLFNLSYKYKNGYHFT